MKLAQHKITPFLWFEESAEEAAAFYVSLFDGSRISGTTRYREGGPGEPGSVMTVSFTVAGLDLIALNGNSDNPFTHAVSLFVSCDSQAEIDRLWDALLAGGGEPVACGWLRDRFGLSWQIVPARLGEMLSDDDGAKAQRAMAAMMEMEKLDIAALEEAFAGTPAGA